MNEKQKQKQETTAELLTELITSFHKKIDRIIINQKNDAKINDLNANFNTHFIIVMIIAVGIILSTTIFSWLFLTALQVYVLYKMWEIGKLLEEEIEKIINN